MRISDWSSDVCSSDLRYRQLDQAVAEGEQNRAQRRRQQQGRLHAARSEAVEQQPERQLETGEGQEVAAGQQPEVGGREAEAGGELRRDQDRKSTRLNSSH